jgi:hypothetical protein
MLHIQKPSANVYFGIRHRLSIDRTSEVRISEVRTSDVQTSEVRISEVRTSEVRISEVRTSKVRTSDVRISEVRTSKVRTSKVRTSDVRISEVRHDFSLSVYYIAGCSELCSGIYYRVKLLSTDVSEVRTASIIRDETRQYIPEDNSEHHTRSRENLKSHI